MKKEDAGALLGRLRGLLVKYRYAVAVLAAGVLLLSLGGGEEKSEPAAQVQQGMAQGFNLAEFERAAAAQLSRIDGVGRLELMLTLESTGESVYAQDRRESVNGELNGSREESITVVSGSGYEQKPVTVKELYPTFRGAVVLCEGADDIHVRCAVVEAVSTLCGIGADKVAVLKMQGGEP